jgi:3-oxoacyl-[acyl-carrier protein] reductase
MLARGRGRIINVASAAGEVAVPYMSAYNASKTAVIRFTETLASELREHEIPVFAITPGPVRTAMTEELITSEAGKRWLPWCERLFENRQDVSVEPATTLVVFLSTGAGDHLSGKLLSAKERPADLAGRIKRIRRDDLYTLQLRRPESLRRVMLDSIKDRLRPVKRSLESLLSTGSRQA